MLTVSGNWGILTNQLQRLVALANPACLKCHGRAVVCQTWSENQAPLGSGRVWEETFYEEDYCQCLTSIPGLTFLETLEPFESLFEEPLGTGPFGGFPTLYEFAHWGCRICQRIDVEERRSADRQEAYYVLEHLQEAVTGAIPLEARSVVSEAFQRAFREMA